MPLNPGASSSSVSVGTLSVGSITGIDSTVAVYFSPSSPAVSASFSAASIEVIPTTGSRKTTDDASASQRVLIVGSQSNASLQVSGINSSVEVYVGGTAGTLTVDIGKVQGLKQSSGDGATATSMLNILPMALNAAGTHDRLRVDSGLANRALRVVHATDVGTSVNIIAGSIVGITNSVSVHVLSTGGTIQVKTDPSSVLAGITSSIAVYFDRGNPTVTANAGTGTFNVQLDPGHTLGNIGTINSITNTVAVFFSPSSPAVNATFSAASLEVIPTTGSRKITDDASASQRVLIVGSQSNASLQVSGITNSISAYISGTAGTLGVRVGQIDGTVAVYFSPSNPTVSATFSAASLEVVPTTGSRKTMDDAHAAQRVLIVGSQTAASLTINGTVTANAGTGSMTVQFDPGHELGSIKGITNSIAVHILSTGGTIQVKTDPASVLSGITSSINVYIGATAGTMGVRVGQVDGTVAVYFSQSRPIVLADAQHTTSIFTVSGSTSGGTTSGVTLVSPSANYNFKIFAYSIQTTALSSGAFRFTNGAGTETELWRPLVTAAQTTATPIGANMAVPAPAFIFATGTNVTLALKSDSGSLVHYSVSYIKESA